MKAYDDIDRKRARSWKNANISKIQDIPNIASTKKEFLESIKNIVIKYVEEIRSNRKDDKYRNIVDLIMLRINSELNVFQDIIKESYIASNDDFVSSIYSNISNKILDLFDTIKTLSIKDFIQQILNQFDLAQQIIQQEKQANAKNKTILDQEKSIIDNNSINSKNKYEDSTTHQKIYSVKNKKIFSKLQNYIEKQFNKINALCIGIKISESSLTKTNIIHKKIQENTNETSDSIQNKSIKLQINKHIDVVHKLPNYIIQDAIYKYNKNIFDKLSLKNITFMLKIIKKYDFHKDFIQFRFSIIPDIIEEKTKTTIKLLKAIYNAAHKNILNSIIDFFKEKIFSKLLKPLKNFIYEKIISTIAKCIGYFSPIISNFLKKLKNTMILALHAFRRAFKWLIRISRKVISTFASIFGSTIRLLKNLLVSTYKLLKGALSLALNFLRRIGKFARRIYTFVAEKIKNTKIGRFFSKIKSSVSTFFSKIKTKIQYFKSTIIKKFTKLKNAIIHPFSTLARRIKIKVTKIKSAIKKTVKKVITSIARFIKTAIITVAKRVASVLGINIAKNIAKKQLLSKLKIGATKFIKFLNKWILKVIVKFSKKLAAKLATSLLGPVMWVVNAALLIYDIYDMIKLLDELVQFFKDNPEVWTSIKSIVFEWLSKAIDFTKKVTEAGKRLFKKIFIDGPRKLLKKYVHLWNLALHPFSSIKRIMKGSKYEKQLEEMKQRNIQHFNSLSAAEKQKLLKENLKRYLARIEKLHKQADELTKLIEKEQDSWWPDNTKIQQWMDERQVQFMCMMDLVSTLGIEDFSKESCRKIANAYLNYEKAEERKKEIEEKIKTYKNELNEKYASKKINLEVLQEILKEHKEKQASFINDLNSFSLHVQEKATKFIQKLNKYLDDDEYETVNDTLIAIM